MTNCSIIIPTHNRPSLLLRAVGSALAGLPRKAEIIVVDDASDTPVEQVLADPVYKQVRVVRIDVPSGGGGSPARNRGIEQSTGEVLFFLDDDDEVLPDYYDRILTSAIADGADFGFAARKYAKADGSTCRIEDRGLPHGFVSTRTDFARRTFPFSAGFWMKRDAYKVVGAMSERLATNSDTEYCCRLYASELRGWFSPEPGVVIYPHNNDDMKNVTSRAKSADRATAFRLIAETHSELMAHDAGASEFIYARWIKHALRAGQGVEARYALSKIPQRSTRLKLAAFYLSYRVSETFR
ncbi:MAG: glycosyltransferase family 2 protein [Loktanella sp.]|nr:glycosyltransferase family 2 protein [Loktanella sp.]